MSVKKKGQVYTLHNIAVFYLSLWPDHCKRFVVVVDANGKTIKQHPVYEQVFQPVFTADGKSVDYGVKTGNEFWCTVEKLKGK